MVYLILNLLAVLLLAVFTRQLDKHAQRIVGDDNSMVVTLLLATIEAGIFTFALLFSPYWVSTMTKLVMKLLFIVEGLFLVTLFCALVGLGLKQKTFALSVFRIVSYVIVVYIVVTKFKTFELSYERGISIGSEYLFSAEARRFFPWTWVTLYNAVYRIGLPTLGCLIMLILRERKSTPLQRYQSLMFVEAFAVMWGFNIFLKFMSNAVPSYSLLYMYIYVLFFALVYLSFRTTSVPSGCALVFGFFRTIVSYLVPAVVLALLFASAKSIDTEGFGTFEVIVIVASAVAVLFSWKISDIMMSGTRASSNEYEVNFEKELATIDYSGEMDDVTRRMYEVCRHNIECASMCIYVDDGHGMFSTAYSSYDSDFKMPVNSNVFSSLLNMNRNIIIQSEIDDFHDFDVIRDELKELMESVKSDAFILLNEGNTIVGIITFGTKISGDHYKEYDRNVFSKLYSYFFVFGYYVRNISNKDVLSTVNREIRMASQIITSIQENIDSIKNNKMDVGYKMVAAHNIGGEFVDLIRLTENRHLLVIGDLSGKGIAASMNMVILKSIIHTYLAETHDFKLLVAKINTFIRESFQKGTIFAGLFALLDFETDTMYYINCGIPALFMYTRVYNNVIEIQGSGYILGFAKDIMPYLSVKTTKLNRGDIILACTDGLINSHSLRGEKFGKERVQQAILDNSTYPAQRMAQFTFDGLTKFMSKEMEDDVSILVFKYKSSAEFATPEEIAAERAAAEAVANQFAASLFSTIDDDDADVAELEEEAEEVPETESSEQSNEMALDIPSEADIEIPDMAKISEMMRMAEMGEDFMADIPEQVSESTESENADSENSETKSEIESDESNSETVEATSENSGETAEESSEPKNEDMFVEDISASSDEKKDDGIPDFDPTAFGLPEGFEL